MDKPLVSIVTPSYNQGRFIEQNILSIKGQSYPNIEHIIIDGGSTDQTLDILKLYEGTYNMRWSSSPDNGMYHAINKGFSHAKGAIFAYLNTDDNYMPWSVETAVGYFTRHSDIDLVYGGLIQVGLGENQHLGLILPATIGMLKRGQSLEQPTVFWNRKVYKKLGGFDEDFVCAGDIDFWRRAISVFKFLQIKEILAIEHVHSNRLSLIKIKKLAEEVKKLDSKYLSLSNAHFYSKLFKKLNDIFWMKIHGIIFIFSYLMYNKTKKRYPYARLFGFTNFIIKNPINFIVGCVPFCNKGFKRWKLDGNFRWEQGALKYYEPS